MANLRHAGGDLVADAALLQPINGFGSGVLTASGRRKALARGYEPSYHAWLSRFVSAALGLGRWPDASPHFLDVCRSVAVIEAAEESARSGAAVADSGAPTSTMEVIVDMADPAVSPTSSPAPSSCGSQSPTPLFIFAVPRSGSTLLQRLLAAHRDITTATEPHILLPLLFALRRHGVYAEYRHAELAMALEDFCRELPNGVDDYLAEVQCFARNLYAKATKAAKGNPRYFLDKTPSYHTVVEDIIRLFPDGKFIFLWRHPLAVAASCMESWNGGRWNLFRHKIDHYQGLANLIGAYQAHAGRSFAVRYEDLLIDPENQVRKLFDYLGLDFQPSVLSDFVNVPLRGRVTDLTGTKLYRQLDKAPLDKWTHVMNNPIRRAWCRRYLQWLGDERLRVMGYDPKVLAAELRTLHLSLRRICSDAVFVPYGMVYSALDLQIVKDKLRLMPHWSRVIPHS